MDPQCSGVNYYTGQRTDVKVKCALVIAKRIVCFEAISDWTYHFMNVAPNKVNHLPALLINAVYCGE
uniref:Uncharacterized protein n=1 Tax=Trichobilharzia regenti TaxID=157069 RepID=A0AA85JY66_TRIRE|nr:unnamed protein product [Trichobilharzia regenti]